MVPSIFSQKELWQQIFKLPSNPSNPWLLMGDLNGISNLEEKQSQYKSSSTRYEKLKRFWAFRVINLHGIIKERRNILYLPD